MQNRLPGGAFPGIIRRLGTAKKPIEREPVIRHLSKAGGCTSKIPMNQFRLSIPIFFITLFAASGILAWSAPAADKGEGVLLSTMQAELERAKTSLEKSDPAPYFISYEVYDQRTMIVAGTYGTIVTSSVGNHRWADVT